VEVLARAGRVVLLVPKVLRDIVAIMLLILFGCLRKHVKIIVGRIFVGHPIWIYSVLYHIVLVVLIGL
jgi:hypothetical protein